VDPIEHVKKLREDYERALDAAESKRTAYHEAMLDLIDRGGPSLQEFAKELGLAHQQVHEIVRRQPPRGRHLARTAVAVGGVLVLVAATLAGLRLAHAPPFVVTVRVPRVLNLTEAAATKRIKKAGLEARIVNLRRDVPRSLSHHVLGVSNAPSERVAKGSTVTLYVVIARPSH
jgi:hypothetical protein